MAHTLDESAHLLNRDESRVKDIEVSKLLFEFLSHHIVKFLPRHFHVLFNEWGSRSFGSSFVNEELTAWSSVLIFAFFSLILGSDVYKAFYGHRSKNISKYEKFVLKNAFILKLFLLLWQMLKWGKIFICK